MTETTLVIPAYNEENAIEKTIEETVKFLPFSKIIVVNDGSTDSTLKKLRELQKIHSNLIIINQENKGYGGALKTGFLNSKTEFVGFLDADLTYPLQYLNEMIEILRNTDVDFVVGNRFGGKTNSMPLLRKIGNTIIRYFFFIWTGKYFDVTSGMRLFKKEKLFSLNLETLPSGLDVITAISKRAVKKNLKFIQIDIHYADREGISKLNIVKDFIKMIKNIILE